MAIETRRQTYYLGEQFHDPEWWDEWLERNRKKKMRVLSKRLREQEWHKFKKTLSSKYFRLF
jgi:hypothetical protein